MLSLSLPKLGYLALLAGQAFAAGAYPPDKVDQLAASSLDNLKTYLAANPSKTGCTLETAIKRQEWSDLSVSDREDYIKAVLCLTSKSPKAPTTSVPGARSRYDDFVATHIINTLHIHGTANFLGWHRYYVWAYEKALRDECGYKGYQPYWNWDRYAKDPANSPLLNGNASSMSGDGAANAGCVTAGPFKDMKANLGPVSPSIQGVPANPRADGLGYNPRCLRRAISKAMAAETTADYTYSLITQNKDVYWFQTVMQGAMGVHSGGHFTIGGDPGGDFYTSPGDPAFYLHHGMIDRVWWIWQLQDLKTRLTAISGGTNMMGGGRNGTLSDDVDLGWTAPSVKLGDLLDTMGGNGGKFCYIYV